MTTFLRQVLPKLFAVSSLIVLAITLGWWGVGPAHRPSSNAANQSSATIFGVVTDASTRQPLPGVNVTIPDTTLLSTTGPAGTFEIRDVPAGPVRLLYSRDGYADANLKLGTSAGIRSRANIELVRQSDRSEAAATSTAGHQADLSVGQGTITGTVTAGANGALLPDALVSASGAIQAKGTDARGRYVLRGLGTGSYTISVRRPGYEVATRTVRVQDGETVDADFRLVGTIALGAFVPDFATDQGRMAEFTRLVGRRPAITMWYQSWASPKSREFNQSAMDAVIAQGSIPMVTWEPWDWRRGAEQPQYSLRTIASGTHDPYIRKWARHTAAWGLPMYLRFAHEMNGDWYSWSPGVNGNTTADYVAAWRHVVQIFRDEGATNVEWIWAPNLNGRTPYADVYPGDDYVDWIGVTVLNWGTSQEWSEWAELDELLDLFYTTTREYAGAKPLMIAEMASSEKGGDKGVWIRRTLLGSIPYKYPRIRAVVWFNSEKETDWRVDSSAGSLAAYRAVARSPIYQAPAPRVRSDSIGVENKRQGTK